MNKKYFYLLILPSFIFMYSCLSVKHTFFVNKQFFGMDSLKVDAIRFINDSVCIYSQEYKCDMDEIYKKIEIQCNYRIFKNLLFLEGVQRPAFLKGASCYVLPDSVLKKCNFIFEDTKESPFYINPRTKWSKCNIYGYINNINGVDTLTYYKGCLLYAKQTKCFEENNIVLSTQIFFRDGKMTLKGKEKDKIFKTLKVSINK